MKNKIALIGQLILGLAGTLCFAVVGIMYTKLSFIDTPYLFGGVFLWSIAVFWRVKRRA